MRTVLETCVCGARFNYTSTSSEANCRLAAQEWREQHRHEMTPTELAPLLEREADPQSVWEESWTRTT